MSKRTKFNKHVFVLFTYLSVPLSETNKNPGSSQKKAGYLCQERGIFSLCYCCVKEESKNEERNIHHLSTGNKTEQKKQSQENRKKDQVSLV